MMQRGKVFHILKTRNFDEVRGITLMECPENSKSPTFDWFAYVSVTGFNGIEIIVCVDHDLVSFGSPAFDALIGRLVSVTGISYGYAYLRSYEKGPEAYAMGMGQGIDRKSIEMEQIGNWSRDGIGDNRIRFGMLRDVYLYNILSAGNLNTPVAGSNLGKIIENDRQFGSLSNVGDNLYLWKVDQKNIGYVRTQIKSILIAG